MTPVINKTVEVIWPTPDLRKQERVTLDAKVLTSAHEWAKNNCPSYLTWRFHLGENLTISIDKVDFIFIKNQEGLRDATIFLLKWT